jgi:hypothetical protein
MTIFLKIEINIQKKMRMINHIKVRNFILVFDEIKDDFEEERLRLRYFDCFLTRYVYHSSARWLKRFGALLNLNKFE